MDEPKKSGFWSGLFRSRSNAQPPARLVRQERDRPRRGSADDTLDNRRRRYGGEEVTSSRRRPRRPDPKLAKGKGRQEPNGDGYDDRTPLSGWPPSGMSSEEELPLLHAMELISRGVPAHKGQKRPVTHASDHYYSLYTTSAGNRGDESDGANLHDLMTQLSTLKIQGSGPPIYPWDTLEQPSMAFKYGKRPGTVTLNHWVCSSSMLPPTIALRDLGMVPKEIELEQIFQRLKELESGLEEEDEDLRYRNLYRRLLKDPDKLQSPHKTLDKQITDLIMVLSAPTWIDFTNPKHQLATRFIFNTGHTNHQQYLKFFHQLLLTLELDLRIHSKVHNDAAKERLMQHIPPSIQWGLALSRRWRDNVRIEAYGPTADQVKLRYKLRRRQVKMLKRFAQMMKWPNMGETLEALRQREEDGSLLAVSSHTMAFFSGLILPGSTFPFLLMNSLVDIDPDKATDKLALLTHLHPVCGFQYRNSYTYWNTMCIVGKVLAPTCRELAGWIGPARPTVDLERSQIALIRARRPRERLTPEDVTTMRERSDPLGPPAEVFPVKEYKLLTPDIDDFVDTVRIELLNLRPLPGGRREGTPGWYDASIQFAIDGVSWPLHLTYDVSFINAWPCSDGPHPLFIEYYFTAVKADELVNIRHWGEPEGAAAALERSTQSTPVGGSAPAAEKRASQLDEDAERVLAVEAFGVRDNEVLARAWCSHWGRNAVVADINKTW